jgi:hypothetical protein
MGSPHLPTFQILTGSHEVTIATEPDEWIDPERSLDLLAVMLQPTVQRYVKAQISSRMIDALTADVRAKLLDLRSKGVIWDQWGGAFGIGHSVTVRMRQRGAA